MQSRTGSIIEGFTNILAGYGIAVSAQVVLFPIFLGIDVPLTTNLQLGAAFTVVSLIRQYILRRIFTSKQLFQIREDTCPPKKR